jgi:hypothetical protein
MKDNEESLCQMNKPFHTKAVVFPTPRCKGISNAKIKSLKRRGSEVL